MQEKDLNVPKTVERIQQTTYDRKITIPDAVVSTKIIGIKEEPVDKKTCTGKCETRPKNF